MPFGHYTSISATGPGPTLWYTKDGSWSSTEGEKLVFLQTELAVHSAIINLPAGYHTKVNFENVDILAQDLSVDGPECLC